MTVAGRLPLPVRYLMTEAACPRRLRRLETFEETRDLIANTASDGADIAGGILDRRGSLARRVGRLPDLTDIGGGRGGAVGGDFGAARDFAGGGPLLGHRSRNRGRDLADFADGMLDAVDGIDGAHRRLLHAGDLRGD